MPKAVFLDRDGTIIKDKGYLYRIEDVEFLPGVPEALKALKEAGYLLVIVTNQSGIGRGYYTEEDFWKVMRFINQRLSESRAAIDATYFCPHHPTEGVGKYKIDCTCRKPRPGMLLRAARELNLELEKSFLIGDKMDDVLAALASGARAIKLSAGDCPESACYTEVDMNFYVAKDMPEAASLITLGMLQKNYP